MTLFVEKPMAFIGGGNMARSLVGGLLAKGMSPSSITVSDPFPAQLEAMAQSFAVRTTADNLMAVRQAQCVVLAVKPQELQSVVTALRPALNHRPLVISVAAGIRAADLQQWADQPVVRAMPNRPALNGCGITGLYATPALGVEQRSWAEQILAAVGSTVWVEDESLMDVVTAVSGSGPAYFFLLMELLEAAGVAHGLPAEVARKLAVDTAYGAGRMAHELVTAPSELRAQVTSKGGTTEAALTMFNARDLRGIVDSAVAAAARRSAELAIEFGARGT